MKEETIWVQNAGKHRASDPRNWSDGLPNPSKKAIIDSGSSTIIWDLDSVSIQVDILNTFNGVIEIGGNCFYEGQVFAPRNLLVWIEKHKLDKSNLAHGPPIVSSVPFEEIMAVFRTPGFTREHVEAKGWVYDEAMAKVNEYDAIYDADRFWVGGGSSVNWNATGNTNWSTASGGANDASVPGSVNGQADTATYDGNGVSVSTINVSIPTGNTALTSLTIATGYTSTVTVTAQQSTSAGWGAFTLNAGTLTQTGDPGNPNVFCSTFTMGGGTVNLAASSSRALDATGNISITGGTWTAGFIRPRGSANLSSSITITFLEAIFAFTTTLTANFTYSTRTRVIGGATLAVVATTLTASGSATTSIGDSSGTGAMTFTTGTFTTGSGAVTIGIASGNTGSLGSNSAWVFDCNSALTVAATGTLISTTSATAWTQSASITMNSGSTYTDNGGTLNFDGTSTVTISPTLGAVDIETGAAVTIAALFTIGAFTINAGTLSSTMGAGQIISCAAFTMGGGTMSVGANRQIRATGNISVTAGTWTTGHLMTTGSTAQNVSIAITITELGIFQTGTASTKTLTANLTVSSTIAVGSNSGSVAVTFAVGANTVTASGTATTSINDGSVFLNGTVTFTTGTWTAGGAATIGSSAGGTASFGSNSANTFDCNASLTTNSGGTLSSPSAAGSLTMSGATLTLSGTYTNNGVAFTFDISGTTSLGAAWTSAAAVTVVTGATFSTSGSNYAFTHSGALTTAGSGTFTPNASTVTSNGAVTTAGTGTFGGATAWSHDCNVTLTVGSGTTYSATTGTSNFSGNIDNNGTWTHNSGTMNFDGGAALQTLSFGGATLFAMTTDSGAGDLDVNESVTFAGTVTISATKEWVVIAALTETFNAAITVNGTLGRNVGAFTADINANLTVGAAGIIGAPDAGSAFTFSGATWDMNGTYTANGGTLTFDGGGAITFAAGSVVYGALTTSGANTAVTQTEDAEITVASSLPNSAGASYVVSSGVLFNAFAALTVATGTFGSNTNYTIDSNANITITSTFSAPSATGVFTFSGATFDNNGTYTANSGTITFDLDGAQSFQAGDGTYGGFATEAATTVTQSENTTITVSSSLPGTVGASYIVSSGITLTANAGITVLNGTLGSNTDWIFDMNSTLTVSSTFSAPSSSGTWNQSADCTFQSGSTITHNSGKYNADGNHVLTTNGNALFDVGVAGGVILTTAKNETFTVVNMVTGAGVLRFTPTTTLKWRGIQYCPWQGLPIPNLGVNQGMVI